MIVSVFALAVLAMHGCEAFRPMSAEDLAAYEAQRREWSRRETDADVCEDLCKNEITFCCIKGALQCDIF